MESQEEATQPSTQIVTDPRRLGIPYAGMSREDLADIVCILHPESSVAQRDATLNARHNPKGIISFDVDGSVPIREKDNPDTFDTAIQGWEKCDLALRLSADRREPKTNGWVFGRNPKRCDFILGNSASTGSFVSNRHFRIYINTHGTVMLEDLSTNGTALDGDLLRVRHSDNANAYRHTLEHGQVVAIVRMDDRRDDIRFVVRIPQRDYESQDRYDDNVARFHLRQQEGTKNPVDLFPTIPIQASSSRRREWNGGDKYNRVGIAGKGAFAVVHKITSKYDGVPFAAKEIEKRKFMKNGQLDGKIETEMKIMSQIDHPNIVRFVEVVDWFDHIYIIMEFIPGGELGKLVNQSGPLGEVYVKTMTEQLLDALKYLHSKNITHRDIKPDNVLIKQAPDHRNPIHVVITDFGLSKMIEQEGGTFLQTFCGTLLYCAPEVYVEYRQYDIQINGDRQNAAPSTRQRYGPGVDIWSLAGVLFFSLCGSPPYPAANGIHYTDLLRTIMTKALDVRPLNRHNVSDEGIRFIRRMLHNRPENRATIEDLEKSPWLTGIPEVSVENSMESVDQIDDEFVQVEEDDEDGDSQMSLAAETSEIRDSAGESETTEVIAAMIEGIQSSFDTSGPSSREASIIDLESYEIVRKPNGNGRLFGELGLNSSALGSSGAVPFDHVNLPDTVGHRQKHAQQSSVMESLENPPAAAVTMAPPPPPKAVTNIASSKQVRTSSLMGAESLVGRLEMNSPAATSPSPSADEENQDPGTQMSTASRYHTAPEHPKSNALAPTSSTRDNSNSLRRTREIYDDDSWKPAGLPPKRRRRSEREIDMPTPASLFWDPRDKSTHHDNYPAMALSDYHHLEEFAESKGEKFENGGKTFDEAMQSFRSSRTPSLEPETFVRAQSAPANEQRPLRLFTRDERTLDQIVEQDANLPRTARGSGVDMQVAYAVPVNDFQSPRRILAKLLAAPESCLPISISITEHITTWGRGGANTLQYPRGLEVRVPKYGFKLLLFKPGFYSPMSGLRANKDGEPWTGTGAEDFTFYMSTKATRGILINGVHVPSSDAQQPYTFSKAWGEVRHGDVITVFQGSSADGGEDVVRFNFECFWGQSKKVRTEGEMFKLLPEGDSRLIEIERVCKACEKQVFQIREKKEEEEEEKKLMKEKEREREKKGGKRR